MLHKRLLSAGVVLLFALSGCGSGNVPRGDLAAAQSLGAAASAARDKYAQLANDYQASCERRYRWRRLTFAEQSHAANVKNTTNRSLDARLTSLSASLQRRAAAGNATAAELRRIIAQLRSVAAARATTSAFAADPCNTDQIVAAVNGWNAWNNLLLTYFIGLGNLAAPPKADAFGLNAAATQITGAFPGAGNALSAKANAIAGFATAALQIGITNKEADAVAKYSTGPVAQLINNDIAALQLVAGIYVDTVLFAEGNAVDDFYSNNLDAVPAGTPILGSLQTFLKSWNDDLATVAQKRSAAQAYIASLKALQASYAAVGTAASQRQGPTDLVSTATTLFTQLSPSLLAIDKAFGPQAPLPSPAPKK